MWRHEHATQNSARLLFLLFLTFCLLTCGACASLPKLPETVQEALPEHGAPLRVLGPNGLLSASESLALVERLGLRAHPPDALYRQVALLEAIGASPLIADNAVTLLPNSGTAYDAMFEALRRATDHINLETFIFDDDTIGLRFADLLIEKQAQGVQVSLIYDSAGCWNVPQSLFDRLRQSGIRVLEFNPIDPLKASAGWHPTERDHRKILVVDGKVAFTGGVNISMFSSEGMINAEEKRKIPPKLWRDTDIQVEGPAVAAFQKLFLDTWASQNGPELPQRNYFPSLEPAGDDLVQVIGSTPGAKNRLPYLMYLSAISHAMTAVHLTSAYFAPNEAMVNALSSAAQRGVDVRIIVPRKTDHDWVGYAGEFYFTRLLKAGVKLYERRHVLLHAKTAVIDGVWATVGSTNMDLLSFLHNNEVNAVVLSCDFAPQLEALFAQDIRNCHRIKLAQWEKRPAGDRAKEWVSHLLAYWF